MPFAGQMVGGGEAGRAGSDNGDLFIPFRGALDLDFPGIELVGSQAFEVANGDRVIHIAPAAGIFTPMGADAAENAGQGQVFHDDFERFLVFALSDHLNVALDVQSGRAGHTAGGLVRFLDGKRTWNGLGIFFIGGLSVAESLVVFAGQGDRAHLDAIAAGSAFVRIDVAGFLFNIGFEIAFGTFNFVNFGIGDQIDVQMPADLDQFR